MDGRDGDTLRALNYFGYNYLLCEISPPRPWPSALVDFLQYLTSPYVVGYLVFSIRSPSLTFYTVTLPLYMIDYLLDR